MKWLVDPKRFTSTEEEEADGYSNQSRSKFKSIFYSFFFLFPFEQYHYFF